MQGQQVQPAGNKIDNGDDYDARQHLHSPGAADQENSPVNNIGDNQDINDILPPERAENVRHEALFDGEGDLLF